jgi:hypothetical protein
VGEQVFKRLAAEGLIKEDNFDQRYLLWTSMYAGLCRGVFYTEELTSAEANAAFGVGLSVWGIGEAKAKKIIARPLNFAAIN